MPTRKQKDVQQMLSLMESGEFAGGKHMGWDSRSGALVINGKTIPGSDIVSTFHFYMDNRAAPKEEPAGYVKFQEMMTAKLDGIRQKELEKEKQQLKKKQQAGTGWLHY